MDFASEAIKMAGSLAVVVIVMVGVLMILKRFMGEGTPGVNGPIMKLCGGLRLGSGKSILLVEIAGEMLVLGATSRELTLLTRVDNPDRVEQLRPVGNSGFPAFGLSSRWLGLSKSQSLTSSHESVEGVSR